MADRFVAAFTGTVTGVALDLALSGSPSGSFDVVIFSDAGAAGPGTSLGTVAVAGDASLTSSFALYTFTAVVPIAITAGRRAA